MDKPVECQSQETESNVVEWHDATGWTEDIRDWLLAWIDVVMERNNKPTVTGNANLLSEGKSLPRGRVDTTMNDLE